MGFIRLFTRQKPKIKVESTKKDGFSGWVKCTRCEEMIHANELKENNSCCPKCDYHYRISAFTRMQLLSDKDSFSELYENLEPEDPLKFYDTEAYPDRVKRAKKKSGRSEAALVGTCEVNGRPICLGILDFAYMGGSMGSVVGEKLTRLAEVALDRECPLVIVSASGGARMQESILSLMQMAKTSAALAKLSEAKIPYISILTNPTTGGVTASFASLGDIIIAEPDALIAFAGPRVVEQTIRQKLPDSAQKSEFLLEKGMVDCIVSRKDLKESLSYFVNFLTGNKSSKRGRLKKLDELIALSKKERAKNTIEVKS